MVTGEKPLVMKRGESISQEMLRSASERLSPSNRDPHRRQIAKKWDILTGAVQAHAEKRLEGQYSSDVAREGTKSQISRTMNPAQDIVTRLCQVYQNGVRRRVAGTTKKKNKALAQLYREAHASAMGQDWNREAYFVGPDTVVPRVKSGRMAFDTILPHRRIPVLDEDDPCGKPLGVIYEASRQGDYCTLVSVDQQRTAVWSTGPGGQLKEIASVPNSSEQEQAAPFAELRFDTPRDPADYDSSWRHQRLADGTVDAVVVAAVMGHVRKTQNKKLLYVQGALEALTKGQNLGDPDKPVFLPTPVGQENSLAFGSIDFDQPVDSFLAQLRFLYAAMAESTGVPAMVSMEGPIDLQFAYDGLSEERDSQIVFVDEFERDLACAMVMAAVDGGHPVADDLPSVEEVRKGLTVQYGKMSRRLSDPLAEQQALDWEVRHGLISVLDLLGKRHPDLDDEELLKKLQETLETNTQYWDFMARTNMAGQDPGSGAPVDPSGKVVSAAQANGARGGRPSGTAKNGTPEGGGGRSGYARSPAGRTGRAGRKDRGAGKVAQGIRGQGEGSRRGQEEGRSSGPLRARAGDGGARRMEDGGRNIRRRAWLAS